MNTVKKTLSIIILLALTFACLTETQAQRRKVIYLQTYDAAPYHFGFLLGFNMMGYNLNLKDNYQYETHNGTTTLPASVIGTHDTYRIKSVESNLGPGFSVGVIGDLRLGDYFNLRFLPTLTLGAYKTIEYVMVDDNNNTFIEVSKDRGAVFLEWPLHVKYRSKRYNNIAAYLIGGANYKMYLSGTEKHMYLNGVPGLVQIGFSDVALEVGAGYDIYNQWFKMGVELKASFGLLNLLKTDQQSSEFLYNAPLYALKNNQLQLSFTFE